MMKIKQTTTNTPIQITTTSVKRDLSEQSAKAILEPPKRFKSVNGEHISEVVHHQQEETHTKSRKIIVSESDSVEVISSDSVEEIAPPPKPIVKKTALVIIDTSPVEIVDDEEPKLKEKGPLIQEQVTVTGSFLYDNHDVTSEEARVIHSVLYQKKSNETATTIQGLLLTIGDVRCLKKGMYLNSDVISSYMMICSRKINKAGTRFLGSYFYQHLEAGGFEKVAKTSRRDVMCSEISIFPINTGGNHWILGVINFKEMKIEIYDSLYSEERIQSVLTTIRTYLKNVSNDKHESMIKALHNMKEKGIIINSDVWTVETPKDIPQQENGFDCGVFACQWARCRAQNISLARIVQEDMPFFRNRMLMDLIENNKHN